MAVAAGWSKCGMGRTIPSFTIAIAIEEKDGNGSHFAIAQIKK
jgi:hypothetical protein